MTSPAGRVGASRARVGSVQLMRILSSAAAAAVLLVALTGCGSQATGPTASPTVTVAPASAAPTATATSATPQPSASASVPTPAASSGSGSAAPADPDPNAPAGQCANADLGVSIAIADGGGGAGSEYYNILFTNTGGSSCALRGTPGVSVVGDENGTQLGKPADRIETGVQTIRLGVGESVAAPLKVVNIGTDGGPLEGCTVQKGDGYRVYPPHSKQSIFVKDPSAVACVRGPSFMTVSPVMRRTD